MPHVRACELLKTYGRNTTSFQILEPGLRYWFEDDACVAYAETGGSWVVAGGPIAAPQEEAAVLGRFVEAARAAGKRVRFFGLEARPGPESGLATLQVGVQPVWDPQGWQDVLRGKRSLREQLRRARAKGVTIRRIEGTEVSQPDHPTRRAVNALIGRWMHGCAMAPMGFVVHLDPYNLPEERRFFVAERGGEVVGILVAVPIYALDGWFFEDVLRDPEAPNGTVELLFDHAMRALADHGCRHVTFGLAPLAETEDRWLRTIRDRTRWLYDFEGVRAFKAKLRPTSWRPVYLAFPARERGVRAVIDTLEAFARGSFLRFGLRTLIHRAALVTRWLAILLVPWTLLLAATPVEGWFPSAGVKALWIGWDVLLFALLWRLAARWRRGRSVALSAAAALDFSGGLLQLALFNLGHSRGWLAASGIAVGLAAPLGVSVFLWVARDRGERYDDGRWETPPEQRWRG